MSEPTEDGPRWWHPERVREFDDGPPKRGLGDLVALALIALELDTVRRVTVKALLPSKPLPPATAAKPRCRVRTQVSRAYRRFELNGWVRRDGAFIHVLDRDGLRSWVEQGVDVTDERAAMMLRIEEAVQQINASLATGDAVSGWDAELARKDMELARKDAEVRRLELIALERLMRSAPGAGPSGRGITRVVPRGRAM